MDLLHWWHCWRLWEQSLHTQPLTKLTSCGNALIFLGDSTQVMPPFQGLKRICIMLPLSVNRINPLTQLSSGSMVVPVALLCLASFKSMVLTRSLMEAQLSLQTHILGTKRLTLYTLKALLVPVSQLVETLMNANGTTLILLMITFKHYFL